PTPGTRIQDVSEAGEEWARYPHVPLREGAHRMAGAVTCQRVNGDPSPWKAGLSFAGGMLHGPGSAGQVIRPGRTPAAGWAPIRGCPGAPRPDPPPRECLPRAGRRSDPRPWPDGRRPRGAPAAVPDRPRRSPRCLRTGPRTRPAAVRG